ncbi:MAG: hypothetical protein J5912_09090 [Clostridia bacterium]|nr:hypothetical protein [Clostridia bacterium]
MKKRILAAATAAIMIIILLSACTGTPAGPSVTQPVDSTPDTAGTQTEAPAEPTEAEIPTEAPAEATAEEPPETDPAETEAQTDVPPETAAGNAEMLIEDSYGSAEVSGSSITLDILSTYGDIAFFTLENSANFTLSFRISEYLPAENHQQIGILIAPDVRNLNLYGKFMRTFSGENVIEFYGTAGSWEAPEGGGRVPDPFTDSDSIYLKLTAADGTFTFSASKDGKAWTDFETYNVLFTDDLQIGFTGATFTGATAHAVIDELSVVYG